MTTPNDGNLGDPKILQKLSKANEEEALEIERSALKPTVFPQDPNDEELFEDTDEVDYGF